MFSIPVRRWTAAISGRPVSQVLGLDGSRSTAVTILRLGTEDTDYLATSALGTTIIDLEKSQT